MEADQFLSSDPCSLEPAFTLFYFWSQGLKAGHHALFRNKIYIGNSFTVILDFLKVSDVVLGCLDRGFLDLLLVLLAPVKRNLVNIDQVIHDFILRFGEVAFGLVDI